MNGAGSHRIDPAARAPGSARVIAAAAVFARAVGQPAVTLADLATRYGMNDAVFSDFIARLNVQRDTMAPRDLDLQRAHDAGFLCYLLDRYSSKQSFTASRSINAVKSTALAKFVSNGTLTTLGARLLLPASPSSPRRQQPERLAGQVRLHHVQQSPEAPSSIESPWSLSSLPTGRRTAPLSGRHRPPGRLDFGAAIHASPGRDRTA